jgi:hypothetical protein
LLLPELDEHTHLSALAHSANKLCSGVLQEGAGARVGEWTEHLWSFLKAYSKIARFASRANWWDGFNLLLGMVTRIRLGAFPALLKKRIRRTDNKLGALCAFWLPASLLPWLFSCLQSCLLACLPAGLPACWPASWPAGLPAGQPFGWPSGRRLPLCPLTFLSAICLPAVQSQQNLVQLRSEAASQGVADLDAAQAELELAETGSAATPLSEKVRKLPCLPCLPAQPAACPACLGLAPN